MYIPASTERFSWTKVRCTINERDAQTRLLVEKVGWSLYTRRQWPRSSMCFKRDGRPAMRMAQSLEVFIKVTTYIHRDL